MLYSDLVLRIVSIISKQKTHFFPTHHVTFFISSIVAFNYSSKSRSKSIKFVFFRKRCPKFNYRDKQFFLASKMFPKIYRVFNLKTPPCKENLQGLWTQNVPNKLYLITVTINFSWPQRCFPSSNWDFSVRISFLIYGINEATNNVTKCDVNPLGQIKIRCPGAPVNILEN